MPVQYVELPKTANPAPKISVNFDKFYPYSYHFNRPNSQGWNQTLHLQPDSNNGLLIRNEKIRRSIPPRYIYLTK